MRNLFIQSNVNDNGETFLEVGIEDKEFTAVPSNFNVMSNGSIFIEIVQKDFWKLSDKWGITLGQVEKELKKQFKNAGIAERVVFWVI